MNRPTCKAEGRANDNAEEHRHWYKDPHRERVKFKRQANRARRHHLKALLRREEGP